MRNVSPTWMRIVDACQVGMVGHNFFCSRQIPKFWIMYKRTKATATAWVKDDRLSGFEGYNPFKFYPTECRKYTRGPSRWRSCPNYLRGKYYLMGTYYKVHSKSK